MKVYNKYTKAKYKTNNAFCEMNVFENRDVYHDFQKLFSRYKRNNIYMYKQKIFWEIILNE